MGWSVSGLTGIREAGASSLPGFMMTWSSSRREDHCFTVNVEIFMAFSVDLEVLDQAEEVLVVVGGKAWVWETVFF